MAEDQHELTDTSSRESRGERRESAVSAIGGIEDIGFRPKMEDTHQVLHPFRGSSESFVAVYDGFGGGSGSEIARDMLHLRFRKGLDQGKQAAQALRDAFTLTDSAIEAQDAVAGTTAAVMYLRGERCLVGNVGDTRVVLDRSGKALRLSQDHKPDDPQEKERIESAGGRITEAVSLSSGFEIPARVQNVLAMSRALGAKELGGFVPADPHLHEFTLQRGDRRAILACDGLWDVLSDQEAAEMIEKIQYPKIAGEFLLREAQKRGSRDNITVIVVDFRQSALR